MLSFTKLAQETFDQHNLLRNSPTSFIPDLEALLPLFKGQVLHRPNEIPLRTNEGPSAIKECIQFLKAQKPLPSLQWVPEMAQAAQDHAEDIGPKGIVGHSGSDGSSMSSRLEKYGEWESCVGENIDFGGKNSREVVCNLIVDDGVGSRGHRKNIFNPSYKNCGVGAQKHTAYKTCIVIDYAGGYTRKGEKPRDTGYGGYGASDGGKKVDYDYRKPGQFSDVKDMFMNKFKDVPEVSTAFSNSNEQNPSKFTYSYKTSGQNPITTTNVSGNYDDRFGGKSFDLEKLGKANQVDFASYGFGEKKDERNEDRDKPFDAVQTKITRNITITNGKKCIIEKKIYTLKDGSTRIVENKTIEG